MISVEPSTIIRTIVILVSLVVLALVGVRLSHWKDLVPGQRWHWTAVALLVFSAVYGSAEALIRNIPIGLRSPILLLGMLCLLVSILAPALDPPERNTHMSTEVTVPNDLPWWKRLLSLEPAVVKGFIAAVVLLAGIWGLDVADIADRIDQTLTILLTVIWPIITGVWIRGSVTPASRVVQEVTPNGSVVAGPASPLPDGTPIVAPPSPEPPLPF